MLYEDAFADEDELHLRVVNPKTMTWPNEFSLALFRGMTRFAQPGTAAVLVRALAIYLWVFARRR